ncbi:MAG: aminopeptidase P family protein [Synechococcaceae cyanobacterium SM2_3_1]|nr:aminopeptidase P family protein [Synechococcaceae cyanobacterium SM2_3_1]
MTDGSAVGFRLEKLRQLLRVERLDGFLVPSTDEHLNEYLPAARQRRQWLSGFAGSSGDLLVTLEQAWLAVDSRYHQQAEEQLRATDLQVLKLGLPDQPSLEDTIAGLGSGFCLGIDPFTLSVKRYRELEQQCRCGGVQLVPCAENLVDRLWFQPAAGEQPAYADQPIELLAETITGASITEKLKQLRDQLAKKQVQLLPITKLDQIAWLFNLRGADVPYNPVFIAYALVTPEQLALFTHHQHLSPAAQQHLADMGVEIYEYDAYPETLQAWSQKVERVGIPPTQMTQGSLLLLSSCSCCDIESPLDFLKAQKNTVELEQIRRANLQASRAKLRTLAWLSQQMAQGAAISEAEVAVVMEEHYQAEPEWHGLSFATIAAAGQHSSIVHYSTPDPNCQLAPGQLFLLDSGSHYGGGTTDDTRTVSLGDPTPLQRQRYTEVLKAHIRCVTQPFPVSATGAQLDGITRASLWQAGLDYGHGTGHGVGAYLNVHESPNGISKRVQTCFQAGMITSVEPGYYEPGWGGIRLENLYEVKAIPEREGWLQFSPLTWIPFDPQLIEPGLLPTQEKHWLHDYHQQILQIFHTTLDPESTCWLNEVVDQIKILCAV